ncbi:hypothetical protein ED312_10625 [Sinomicrobium pectinilyticum]|uniref:Uncharacterized protein n=1 Tax=Sinomicrobium pectinilyticum TaxID=1084421 RepID=A0A3N0EHJ4_SINP1|nr:hypothetical protein [Sinomicrobium pectinilyticum]RNL87254.1 hypothetical protein ED312_10625 [Sinomicrobium pectinilyticum]
MKILKLTVIAIGVLALVACRDRKNKDRTDDTYPDTTNNRSSSDMNANENGDYQSGSMRTSVDKEELNALYTHVQMDDEQIKRFERNYQTRIDDMGKNAQTPGNIREIDRDSILREILSPEQYKRYEDWIEDRSR